MAMDMMRMLPTLMELGMRKQQREDEAAYREQMRLLKIADDLRAEKQLELEKEKFGYTRQNDRFIREQKLEDAEREDAKLKQQLDEFNLKKTGGEAFALAQGGGPTNENSALADVFAADPTSARFIVETPGRKIKEKTEQKALDDLISGQKSAPDVLASMGVTNPAVLKFVQSLPLAQQLEYIKTHQPQALGTDEGTKGQFGRFFNPITSQLETQDLGQGIKAEKLTPQDDFANLIALEAAEKAGGTKLTPQQRNDLALYRLRERKDLGKQSREQYTDKFKGTSTATYETYPNWDTSLLGPRPSRQLVSQGKAERPLFSEGAITDIEKDLDATASMYSMMNEIVETFDPMFLTWKGRTEGELRTYAEKLGMGYDEFLARKQAFDSSLTNVQDTMRLMTTGTQAAFAELQNLYKKYVSGQMTASQFMASFDSLKTRAEKTIETKKYELEHGPGSTPKQRVIEFGKPVDWKRAGKPASKVQSLVEALTDEYGKKKK